MFICNVALGNTKQFFKQNPTLEVAPRSYHSVQGVKGENSDFDYDEFVIFDENQQQMKFLVEFSLEGDQVEHFEKTQSINNKIENKTEYFVTENIRNLVDSPLKNEKTKKQKCGLLSKNGDSIPLKKVYVKARLIDMVGEVFIFQNYKNESNFILSFNFYFIFIFIFYFYFSCYKLLDSFPIEAKYVFPLVKFFFFKLKKFIFVLFFK
jgi:hypothetical protein